MKKGQIKIKPNFTQDKKGNPIPLNIPADAVSPEAKPGAKAGNPLLDDICEQQRLEHHIKEAEVKHSIGCCKKKDFKIIFTADLHGNESQYRKLITYAKKVSADAVILGGDICPGNLHQDHRISKQREFLEDRLPKLLKPFKDKCPFSEIYLMLGNDDCIANRDVIERKNGIYKNIHMAREQLNGRYDIVGYSHVPLTPFTMKDWEKFDFSDVPKKLKRKYDKRKKDYELCGGRSEKDKWQSVAFVPKEYVRSKKGMTQEEIMHKAVNDPVYREDIAFIREELGSIQKDLESKLFTKKPKHTLYVTHSPPDRTNLDYNIRANHCGSLAVREFIEQHQPYLTLHGHLHETSFISGDFRQKINSTLCMSPGNHWRSKKLRVVSFDLYHPEKAKQLLL